ncbi:MAG TPA: hypothetical protein VKU19_34545 [Bryobacteraceae bacterium]|nr:hypothetical protein [Bryobacteraceae bacterium]
MENTPGTASQTSVRSLDLLGELGRATTAYHEAGPDRVESAREEYEAALRNFKCEYPPQWSE